MNVAAIKYNDAANGTGIRTVLFVSGCSNHCKGCFQPDTWEPTYGTLYTKETEEKILNSLDNPIIDGITILGGEPFEPYNQPEIKDLILKVKSKYPTKNIWMFTGFLYNDLLPGGKRYIEDVTDIILDSIDVLVDGPFILEKRNLALNFRGSENQRLIDMRKTRSTNKVVTFDIKIGL